MQLDFMFLPQLNPLRDFPFASIFFNSKFTSAVMPTPTWHSRICIGPYPFPDPNWFITSFPLILSPSCINIAFCSYHNNNLTCQSPVDNLRFDGLQLCADECSCAPLRQIVKQYQREQSSFADENRTSSAADFLRTLPSRAD